MLRGCKRIVLPRVESRRDLTEEQIQEIKSELKRLVNVCINIDNKKWFTLRDVVGGENRVWNEPLIFVYNVYKVIDESSAKKNSALDLGFFLKNMLYYDERSFEQGYKYIGRKRVKCYILSDKE